MNELTKKDVLKIFALISLEYKNFADLTKEQLNQRAELWLSVLKDYARDTVIAAVKNTLVTSEFEPKLATVHSEVKKLLSAGSKTDVELWAELEDKLYEVYDTAKYLRYCQHFDAANKHLNDIYNSLSADIKLYVVNVSTLIEIAEMDAESRKFEKARFFKVMPGLRERAERNAQADQLLKLVGGENLLFLLKNKGG